jgi:RNA polymerase sigma factor (sigma-70 family)
MTTYELESDVLLARDGDEAAFKRLVDRCANTVCSIAVAIVRNVQASEDVAQEVFLAAWSNIHTLRNPASFLPWLRQVTRNQAHLWRRRHALEIPDHELLAATADSRPGADQRLVADEQSRVLSEALDRLPEESREVLILYYREESSTRQVAALLGISEQAVRQRVSRSRQLLKAEMLEQFGKSASQTAPGAMFLGVVGGALTLAAPGASAAAAIASTSAVTPAVTPAITAGVVAKAAIAGSVIGWAGVWLGLRAFHPAFDDPEARRLRLFRNVVLLCVSAGCIAVASSSRSVLAMLIAVQTLYLIVGCLYAFWLPRILAPRLAVLRVQDPSAARLTRRRLMWSIIGRPAGAAIGGLVLMAIFLVATQ